MENKYVGDAGDFGNNGLLRWLTGMTGPKPEVKLRLGVVWYLFDDNESAGTLMNYSKNCGCDEDLYARLQSILKQSNRCQKYRTIQAIQRWGILPGNTAYFEDELSFRGTPYGSSRKAKRKAWLDRAAQAMKPADLVFINPDNGISDKPNGIAKSVSQFGQKGPKYTYMDDLTGIFETGKSLVIYHHLRGKGKARNHIEYVSNVLRRKLKPTEVWAFWYHRGTARAYFIVVHPNQKNALKYRLETFKKDLKWCKEKNSPFTYIRDPENILQNQCSP